MNLTNSQLLKVISRRKSVAKLISHLKKIDPHKTIKENAKATGLTYIYVTRLVKDLQMDFKFYAIRNGKRLTPVQKQMILDLHRKGDKNLTIARAVGTTVQTVYRHLNERRRRKKHY